MDILEEELALKIKDALLASGLQGADDGFENVSTALVVNKFDELDAISVQEGYPSRERTLIDCEIMRKSERRDAE